MEKRYKYLIENGYEVSGTEKEFIAKGEYLTFENNPKAFIVTKAPEQSWCKTSIKEELEKLGVITNGHCFAILIEERINNNPLFILGWEDDDRIYFGKYGRNQWEDCFDMAWAHDLMNVTSKAYNFCIK